MLPASLDLIDIQEEVIKTPRGIFSTTRPVDLLGKSLESIKENDSIANAADYINRSTIRKKKERLVNYIVEATKSRVNRGNAFRE